MSSNIIQLFQIVIIFHNITVIYSTFWSALVSIRHFFQNKNLTDSKLNLNQLPATVDLI